MSSVEYKIVEVEESNGEKGQSQELRPFAVPSGRTRPSNQVTRRVAEIVDLELARGSMPT